MRIRNSLGRISPTTFIPASVILMLVFVVSACNSSEEEAASIDCSGLAITYAEVSSIFRSSCAKNSNCHASGSNHGPGALVNYSQIYNARSEIKRAISNGSMPQNGALSSDDKNSILCWIENGASNN
jgi:hypothetical protein